MTTSIKAIKDITIEGIDLADYPDLCDAFIASARWRSSGRELTEDELRQIDPAESQDAIIREILSE